MTFSTISILIPCFNEGDLIEHVLQKVRQAACSLTKEIIVIDDGSTDQSVIQIQRFIDANPSLSIRLLRHHLNQGKGACIRSALDHASGEIIIIQDADFEYDPSEYTRMMKPILDGHADVVFGSRFRGSGPHRVFFYSHTLGNKLLTFLSNLFTGLNLSDMETGYKMFKTDIIKKVRLKEKRFGFEPEITAKVSKLKNIRIYEIGIPYYGRTYKEGKKIRWKDGIRAIYCIIKYNLFTRK